jgi:hypothetical protein
LYSSPPPGRLPTSLTQGYTPYADIGVDFAGPIKYRIKANTDSKAYLILYACSLTCGVYLELLHSMETGKFMRSLRGFVARQGRLRIIYLDNATTFKAAAKLIDLINKDEKVNDYLAKNSIDWKFSTTRFNLYLTTTISLITSTLLYTEYKSLYTDFQTSIITTDFNTPFTSVGKGVLQGDCLSPLFNMWFNTFIQHIKVEKYHQFGFSFKLLNPIH